MRTFSNVAIAVALLLIGFGGPSCSADDAKSQSTSDKPASKAIAQAADLAVIREQSQAFIEAFNQGNAQAISELWTEDCEFIDDQGSSFVGRDAIKNYYMAAHTQNPNARIRVVIDSLKLLSDSAAIEDGRTIVEPTPAGVPGIGKYSVVHVKVAGKWLMSSVRETILETPSTYSKVADLEWLIGTWSAEENGAKMESVCRWLPNKCFVERKYSVTQHDGIKTTGLQLIGWNARDGHVQSWNFGSDGGHAVGVWSPTDSGWSAKVIGVTGDGIPTSAINLLTRLDDNAYVAQSTNRTAGGQTLPDTDEVVLKRQADTH